MAKGHKPKVASWGWQTLFMNGGKGDGTQPAIPVREGAPRSLDDIPADFRRPAKPPARKEPTS